MERRNFIKTSVLTTAGLAMAGSVSGMSLLNQSAPTKVLLRRNIEDLWREHERGENDQFKKYLAAMEMLKEGNPVGEKVKETAFYKLGYLHNRSCVHGSSLFLPWHRALLTMFEKCLQATHPDHAEVTIPYVDFTNSYVVSGKYFPKAFEDPDTMLSKQLKAFTYDNEVDKWGWENNTRQAHMPSNPFSWVQEIQKNIDAYPIWSTRSADDAGNYGFAGQLGGSGQSNYESSIHNPMHNEYIAGLLRSTTLAAFDPIFWSFHAFIDVVVSQWQKQGNTIPEDQHGDELIWQPSQVEMLEDLKSKFNLDSTWLKGTWTVGEVIDTKKLGYEYEFTPPQGVPTQRRLAPIALAKRDKKSTSIIRHSFEVSNESFKKVFFPIEDMQLSMSTSYKGYLFLYPASVKFQPKKDVFIEKYLVDDFLVWAMPPMEGMMMMSDKIQHTFDLTDEINHLKNSVPRGQEWIIEVTVAAEEIGNVEGQNFASFKSAKTVKLVQEVNSVEHSDNLNNTFNFKNGSKLKFIR